MLNCLLRATCGVVILAGTCGTVSAEPPTAQEAARQKASLEALAATVTAAKDEGGKRAALEAAAGDASVEVRRRVLDLASTALSRDREAFFKAVLEKDRDAGIRAQAAAALGRFGTPAVIPALALAAKADPETRREVGCIVTRGTARRDATFALADLAERLPKSSEAVAAELRKLAPADEQDRHAAQAALYRVTRDPAVLAPVLKQLDAPEPARRREAVVQLRFFGLKNAPPGLIQRVEDADAEVRSWAALTLGEIGDAAAVPALTAAASDVRRDLNTRANAIVSLARLKSGDAVTALERLRNDPEPAVRAQAEAALAKLAKTPAGRSSSPSPE